VAKRRYSVIPNTWVEFQDWRTLRGSPRRMRVEREREIDDWLTNGPQRQIIGVIRVLQFGRFDGGFVLDLRTQFCHQIGLDSDNPL
jgi:hypothetical protein